MVPIRSYVQITRIALYVVGSLVAAALMPGRSMLGLGGIGHLAPGGAVCPGGTAARPVPGDSTRAGPGCRRGRSTRGGSFCRGVLLPLLAVIDPVAVVLPSGSDAAGVRFVEVSAEAGIDHVHVNGASGRKYFPETMGGGVAFLDYDGDGHLDVYLVNGAPLPGYRATSERGNRLYRNRGNGIFEEIGKAAGANDGGYGMGCAAADYDSDGNLDLLVTNYGTNAIYRNQGDRGFADATRRASVGDTSWSTSAAFLDYDNDGDLDLYVANYVKYDLSYAARELAPYVAGSISVRNVKTYPHPGNFSGAADVLYGRETAASST